MIKRGKGVSPVIATVLLIGMVLVIALIIFLWIRGFTDESITKFDNQNIELVCGKVNFEAEFKENTLHISNTGNIPIHNMLAKISKSGNHQTIDLGDNGFGGMDQGVAQSVSCPQCTGSDSIVLIPVLRGESNKGPRTFQCNEDEGIEIL